MGWKLISKPTTVKATKAMATKWAEMPAAPHDRPLSERRLQVYERILAAGGFRPVTWADAICRETGDVFRVNGKHTSTLLSKANPLPELFVTLESYECDTLEDVAHLYATFDSAMQSRSSKDIYLSFAGTVKELIGVTEKVIVSSISGMSYAVHHESVYRTQAAERAELVLEHPEFVLWLGKLLSGGQTELTKGNAKARISRLKSAHLYRSPVVAAMFTTWQRAKAASTDFWTAVRDETGAKPDCADRKLARWLLTTTLANSEHNRAKTAGTRETYCKCILAWNAWRKEAPTSLAYYPDAKLPVAV